MTPVPKQADELADIPILTEVVGEDLDIPTLTEIIDEEVPALISQAELPVQGSDAPPLPEAIPLSGSLSDIECQRIAEQIAPQLEKLLHDKFISQFEALWQASWREAQASLPGLIRGLIEDTPPPPESALADSTTVANDIDHSASADFAESGSPAFDSDHSASAFADSGLPVFDIIAPLSETPEIPEPNMPEINPPEPSTTTMELAKSFEPQAIEAHWYPKWENAGCFHATTDADKPAYCIMLPPPNVTGTLHMGHSFQDTLMDALIRYHRMKGDNTLWQPGTDHAGIATQIVVERQLDAKGLTRHDLGREKFLERVWEWKEESGSTITRQMRRLGASCDWSRERFTMDEGLSEAVTEVFVKLHEQGLIYRGKRLVNWDPVLGTAVSDLEVVSQEEDGSMWHIAYPLETGVGALIVATTRPETLLGDVAVAVHPEDARYKHLIGQQLLLPLTDRTIPIIADE